MTWYKHHIISLNIFTGLDFMNEIQVANDNWQSPKIVCELMYDKGHSLINRCPSAFDIISVYPTTKHS